MSLLGMGMFPSKPTVDTAVVNKIDSLEQPHP
jgi:hypothetical protein